MECTKGAGTEGPVVSDQPELAALTAQRGATRSVIEVLHESKSP